MVDALSSRPRQLVVECFGTEIGPFSKRDLHFHVVALLIFEYGPTFFLIRCARCAQALSFELAGGHKHHIFARV